MKFKLGSMGVKQILLFFIAQLSQQYLCLSLEAGIFYQLANIHTINQAELIGCGQAGD